VCVGGAGGGGGGGGGARRPPRADPEAIYNLCLILKIMF
jgi:hypothetical protein